MAQSLRALGEIAWRQGDYTQVVTLQREAVSVAREAACTGCTGRALYNLGRAALEQRDLALARGCLTESLALWRERGERQGIVQCLEGLAAAASGEGQPEGLRRAARLWGAAAAARQAVGLHMPPLDRTAYDRQVAAARAQCDEAAWETAWAEGQAMPLEQAITDALEEGG